MTFDGVASRGYAPHAPHTAPGKGAASGPKMIVLTVASIFLAVAVALAISVLEVQTGFGIYQFFIWFILPVGAVACGFVAASGFAGFAWLLHVKPGKNLRYVAPLLLSVGVFGLVNLFNYFQIVVGDLSFIEYLELNITQSEYGIGSSGSGGSTLGSLGYLLVLVQLAGFAVGGFLVADYLSNKPYCEPCGRYLKKQETASRHSDSPDHFEPLLRWAVSGLAARDYTGVLGHLKGPKPDRKQRRNPVVVASSFGCDRCQDLTVHLRGQIPNGNNLKSVYERTFPTQTVPVVDTMGIDAAPAGSEPNDMAPPVAWQQPYASDPYQPQQPADDPFSPIQQQPQSFK